jgi:ABC-type sugar transport system substrate-binding protein
MQNHWIALFLHDRVNNYQLLLRDDAEKTAQRYDHKVVSYSAEKNADTQTSQIRRLIADSRNNPPAAILVSPVRESNLIGVMVEAAKQRIPWIYLCRWSDTIHVLRRDYKDYAVFSVAADHTQIGRLQGQMLRRLLTDKHELVFIQGPQGTSSVSLRQAALQRELESLPKLRWVPYNSDWSTDGGAIAVRSWLANFKRGKLPEYAVCAQNDDMAWGARMALAQAGHIAKNQNPVIIGCDGLATFGQRLVAEGVLTATVIVPPVSGRALDELFRALSMKVSAPAEVSVDVIAYPGLENLTRSVDIYAKLISPQLTTDTHRQARVVSMPPAARATAANPTSLIPHSVSSSKKPEPSDAASRLFAATLKEVAESSRQATAARAISAAVNDGAPQAEQSSESSSATAHTSKKRGNT